MPGWKKRPNPEEIDPVGRAAVTAGIARAIVDVAVHSVAIYLGCDEPAARRMLEAALADLERRS